MGFNCTAKLKKMKKQWTQGTPCIIFSDQILEKRVLICLEITTSPPQPCTYAFWGAYLIQPAAVKNIIIITKNCHCNHCSHAFCAAYLIQQTCNSPTLWHTFWAAL